MRYLWIIVLLVFAGGCGGSGGSDGPSGESSGEVRIVSLSIAASAYNSLSALVDVETSGPVRCRVRYVDSLGVEQVTPLTDAGTTHHIAVAGFRAGQSYDLTVEAIDSQGIVTQNQTEDFSAGPLPAGIPEFSVVSSAAAAVADGITIFGPQDKLLESVDAANVYAGPMFIGIDREGEVIWYLDNPDPELSVKDQDIKLLDDGTLLYFSGSRIGVVTIAGEPLVSFSGADLGGRVLHHDAIRLPNGHFMALTQESRTMTIPLEPSPVEVLGDVIIEFNPSGEILWSWSCFDHLDTSRYPNELSQQPKPGGVYDWTHANAIVYREEDDSILLSLRHQNWVLKIDHGTSELLWTLGTEGDFTLTGAETDEVLGWFYGQHAPEWRADGSLLLYDNGTLRPGLSSIEYFSRGAEYRLNEQTRQAELLWQWSIPTFTSYLGDADRLENGNTLLCAGGVLGPRSQASVIEVSPQGDVVWELAVPDYNLYRATRLSSFYP